MRRLLLPVLVVHIISICVYAERLVDSVLVQRLQNDLQGALVRLRPTIGDNPKTYFQVDNDSYYFERSTKYRSSKYLVFGQEVKITSIDGLKDAVQVSFTSKTTGLDHIFFPRLGISQSLTTVPS